MLPPPPSPQPPTHLPDKLYRGKGRIRSRSVVEVWDGCRRHHFFGDLLMFFDAFLLLGDDGRGGGSRGNGRSQVSVQSGVQRKAPRRGNSKSSVCRVWEVGDAGQRDQLCGRVTPSLGTSRQLRFSGCEAKNQCQYFYIEGNNVKCSSRTVGTVPGSLLIARRLGNVSRATN